jgi:hypothetical protein
VVGTSHVLTWGVRQEDLSGGYGKKVFFPIGVDLALFHSFALPLESWTQERNPTPPFSNTDSAPSMSPVRIVDVSYIAVPTEASLPPEPVKLNAMEAQWVLLPLLQHLLFFDGEQLPPFDTVLRSLKSSLAATLATHAPLTGKLVHLAGTGDVVILCSASDAIEFVVAEPDVRRLAGDEELDVHTLERLVPGVDMTKLPASLLTVQATRFEGGGVSLGVTVHHGVADGPSLWWFVEAWAAACPTARRRRRLQPSTGRASGCLAARSWPGVSCGSTRRIFPW